METNRVSFSSPTVIPPGGEFFFELNGRRYEGRTLDEICRAMIPYLNQLRIRTPPEELVARYMCPRIGKAASWLCRGQFPVDKRVVSPTVAMSSSERYFGRELVDEDVVSSRLSVCAKCRKHYRAWCPTCPGHLQRIVEGLGPPRRLLDGESKTGVCLCAKAYESAVCSVEYGEDEKVWDDAPETCWRNS